MVNDYRWAMRLIDRCYEAATDDDHWPSLLEDIRTFLDGQSATLFFTDAQLQPIDRFFADNVSPEAISNYQAHYHSVDIRMQRAIPGSLNKIVTDGDLVDRAIIEEHEFYQDFLRPFGHRYVVAAILDLADGHYAFCSCHRGLNQDHADSETLDRAGLILPHIQRSLQLRRRMALVNARGDAAFEVLDGLGQGVFLVDNQGRIVWQNASADRILRQEDGLITTDGELRALSTTTSTELQKLIKSAITRSTQPRALPGGMITVSRPSLKRPYQILVTPLAATLHQNVGSRWLGGSPAAAIFIMDVDQKSKLRIEVLRLLYNLTPAEARLATALGSGCSIKAYAERCKLSIHYARWLLKQVEAKTDTRRMSDLIRLLAKQTAFFGPLLETGDGEEN